MHVSVSVFVFVSVSGCLSAASPSLYNGHAYFILNHLKISCWYYEILSPISPSTIPQNKNNAGVNLELPQTLHWLSTSSAVSNHPLWRHRKYFPALKSPLWVRATFCVLSESPLTLRWHVPHHRSLSLSVSSSNYETETHRCQKSTTFYKWFRSIPEKYKDFCCWPFPVMEFWSWKVQK